MRDHRTNQLKIRSRAVFLGIGGLAAASMMAVGCADVGDPNAGSRGAQNQSVTQVQSALTVDCSTIQLSDASVDVKKLVGLGADVVKAYYKHDADSFVKVAFDLWNLGGSPSVDDLMANLNAKLLCFAQASDWKELALDYNNTQFAPVSAAFMEAQSAPFPRGSGYDVTSHDGTVASGGLVMFERLYGAGDPPTNGPWKNIITNSHPDILDNSQVFDWRMALPGFVRLLAARLAIIGTMDPNFMTDGQWTPELGDGTSGFPGYRGVLTARLQQMIAGVRCDYKDRLKGIGNPQTRSTLVAYDHTDVACADVNTGLSSITTYVRPDNSSCVPQVWAPFLMQCLNKLPSTANMPSQEDGMRRQLLHQMPIFEMQSLIDALYLYTHPATDLTAAFGRIPLAANPGLCLDVPGANPAPGTQVQIYSCNAGTPQQFSYDRKAGTIVNTALGKCLQVRPLLSIPVFGGTIVIDNLFTQAAAETSDCVSPTPDRQKWTYDPGAGTIRSALGTVLDVQWGVLQSGTPVWLWDYNGGSAQVWRADHSNDYCYNSVCSPACQASCANAGPGTGSCMGGCMGGCMGNCMTTWP